jgi:S1-C subfamily serine protease
MASPPEALELKPLDVADLPPTLAVPAEGLSLGRDPSNKVVLSAQRFPHVSSHHARVSLENAELVVEDLGSTNGTVVNGADVKRCVLKAGDVLQLGRNVGPRFVVVRGDRINSTILLSAPPRQRALTELGSATVSHLRSALGIPQDQAQIQQTVRRVHRRLILGSAFSLLVISAVAGFGIAFLERHRANDFEKLHSRIERAKENIARQEEALESQKSQLEKERAGLLAQLQKLEKNEQTSSAEITRLREQLISANAKLEKFKPISLQEIEEERKAALKKILDAVVLIERKIFFKDREKGRRLFLAADSSGVMAPNFEGKGEALFEEIGGSGFSISEEGWLVTNAHVVAASDLERGENLEALKLTPDVELAVVFSGTARRHEAKVIQMAKDDENDLALLRIEPFAGMPYIKGMDLGAGVPLPGAELRVVGFPFGKKIPQEGDTVSASVFSGVLSRKVGRVLQVDAAVYPGNSGGPVIDVAGNVVGIVTSVQTLPSGQISEIGYVIPIARLGALWPPNKQ